MIEFEDVTKRYPDGTVAVDSLSLRIPSNEITVFVGPSGCGKTTSLRMINRTIERTSGRISIDGEDINAKDPVSLRRGIGYVIQQSGLFPHRTVADNIATVPKLLGWDRKRQRARSLELIDLVGLATPEIEAQIAERVTELETAVARPSRGEVASLLRMSAWLTGGLVLTNLLLASDVLILGMVVSPAVVATYVLTGSSARMSVTLFNFTVGATTAGLGGLMGQREYERAAQIRRELVTLTWLFVTVAGATILLLNRSFVSLWVGEHHFAGAWANLLIVCVMAQTAFIRGDAFIIDAALRPRPRVIVTGIAAALTLAATLALTPALGIAGLCLGILVGRLPQTIAYPRLVASCLQRPRALDLARTARRLIVMAALFAAAAWLGQRVVARDWLEWLGATVLTVGVAFGVAIAVGLGATERRAVFKRYLSMGRAFRG